jgi:hypothetical protein
MGTVRIKLTRFYNFFSVKSRQFERNSSTSALATGWSKLHQMDKPDQLQRATLQIFDHSKCIPAYYTIQVCSQIIRYVLVLKQVQNPLGKSILVAH